MIDPPAKHIIVGITGASGGPYATRLLDRLDHANVNAHVIISPMGEQLLTDECGVSTFDAEGLIGHASDALTFYDYRNVGSVLASGSYPIDGMVICPTSSNTLGAIASGLGNNLMNRAAAVTLKESRRLVLVHREMPLSAIDLENMLKLSRAGAILAPAAPGFYLKPQRVEELVDFVVAKILDLLGIEHDLNNRWPGKRALEAEK